MNVSIAAKASPLTFAVLACRAEPLARMAGLAALPKGSAATGQRVRAAVLEGPLFTFREGVTQSVTT